MRETWTHDASCDCRECIIPHGFHAGAGGAFRRRMNSVIEVSGYDLPSGFHGSRPRQVEPITGK
jgi:hypothetical protein